MPLTADWPLFDVPPGIADPGEAANIVETGGRHTIQSFIDPQWYEVAPGAGEGAGETYEEGAGEGADGGNGEIPTAWIVGGVLAAGALAYLLWR